MPLICLVLAGCGSDKKIDEVEQEHKVFSTADFAFRMPEHWSFLESKSTPEQVVFQAQDSGAQLMISIMKFDQTASAKEATEAFSRVVEHRREAEQNQAPPPDELTPIDSKQGEALSYARWYGKVKETDQCSATLVTLENNKLFTLFIERQGIDPQAIADLSQELFANFKVK